MTRPYTDYLDEILITTEQLQKRVAELGAQISADYSGQDLLLVCILKGGVMFLTDLMRQITVPHAIDFMAVTSYGAGTRESTGVVRILMDLEIDISGRNVLLVEDIIDSGHTLDYVGFKISNKFVFGYGLDLDEVYRNLLFIGVVRPEAFIPS
jgi:hypoxanthine phosphoribosyltransferase